MQQQSSNCTTEARRVCTASQNTSTIRDYIAEFCWFEVPSSQWQDISRIHGDGGHGGPQAWGVLAVCLGISVILDLLLRFMLIFTQDKETFHL